MNSKYLSSAIVAAVSLLLISCGGPIDEFPDAQSTFEATFDSKPSKAITALMGEGSAYGDSSHCYLRFNAPNSTVVALVGSSFAAITQAEFASRTTNAGIIGPTPAWWAPPVTPSTTFYSSTGFHPSFSRGSAYYSFDSASQLVCFYWDGVD